jgi:dissimilatory sulfite reductase (desulfoviridin) alpha/beta subunit
VVRNEAVELLPKLCVGCGLCIKECPQQAIESKGVQFRILAGGKMGRHPKWAQELCVVDGSNVVQVVESFLDKVISLLRPDEHMAALVGRIGLARLMEEVLF